MTKALPNFVFLQSGSSKHRASPVRKHEFEDFTGNTTAVSNDCACLKFRFRRFIIPKLFYSRAWQRLYSTKLSCTSVRSHPSSFILNNNSTPPNLCIAFHTSLDDSRLTTENVSSFKYHRLLKSTQRRPGNVKISTLTSIHHETWRQAPIQPRESV